MGAAAEEGVEVREGDVRGRRAKDRDRGVGEGNDGAGGEEGCGYTYKLRCAYLCRSVHDPVLRYIVVMMDD